MTIEELAADLPNGLHDALLRAYSSDLGAGRAELMLDVWVGDLHRGPPERDLRRAARLELLGLTYFVIDALDERYPLDRSPLQIDLCAPDDDRARFHPVPEGGFAGRFFVTEWNAFIHFAALEARLTWVGTN